jgi:NAD(P)-dependent dehydrogenase (short-subunit alcohol dehydrogenase family)
MNPPIRQWQGQRVWLVGASTGIGRATASALHARGVRVIVSARSPEPLHSFVDAHPGAQALPLDSTDRAAVAQAAQTLLADGPLDMVVYCAGVYQPMRATDFQLDVMLQHDQVNYVGALYVLDAVLPAMLERRQGHIGLISSVAGFRGLPNSLAYGPTKAALTHLAETLYLDLQDHHIGVSAIHPGFVQTPLTAQNQFHMPALMSPDDAALAMIRGWERGHFEMHFPRRFTGWLKLLRLLPYRLYFPLVKRATGL